MNISGTGITTFQCKTLPKYKTLQVHALKWINVSSGNWKALDRGAASDYYEAKISIYGVESVINNFCNQIFANRMAGSNSITLNTFASTEHIFGENVNHSVDITASVMDMPQRRQGSWKGYGLADIHLRASSVAFTGSSAWPTLSYCDIGPAADADYSIRNVDSYTGTISTLDHQCDDGIFEGTFTLANADFITALNYIRLHRGSDYTIANTFGCAYPFGPRSLNSYPYTAKLIDWEDMGWFGLKYNKLRLKFAEVSG
jgi:hypothetical protein